MSGSVGSGLPYNPPGRRRGLSGLDIETKIGGRSALISKLVAFMKDTVYKTRIPSVTKRRTCLQHFMRTEFNFGVSPLRTAQGALQEDGTCYAASENDYEWNDPEQPFIEIDDDNDEEEEQTKTRTSTRARIKRGRGYLRKYKRWSHYHYIACFVFV
ncbi:hypothetical protein SEMRO_1287_G259520.1 [Seminavis robusta]|uniref:Uncharacterized protein n=1 Tax=Seminavis robusta TaxID=568900 RepID=A0A9N8EPF4_9STRA|nr:hypothetical protein SEMRO_1287_G259520.1 [Seminavis robusta]|eukprot:Sro1287_g259520.1 n/a (157) ;mRNA; r:29691-30161